MTRVWLSDGTWIDSKNIRSKLKAAYRRQEREDPSNGRCECCMARAADDHDHTISQARCKQLKKGELIWDKDNWSRSCRSCHMEWESYKSGKFKLHKNYIRRMLFLRKHDPEGYRKRLHTEAYMEVNSRSEG